MKKTQKTRGNKEAKKPKQAPKLVVPAAEVAAESVRPGKPGPNTARK